MKNRILILGIMGHIGYALSIFLSKKNYKVIGTYNKSKNKKYLKNLNNNNIKIFKCNLGKKDEIGNILKKNKFDICIYSAAISHDSVAKKFPESAIDVNCYGLANILSFQKKYNFNLINISTGSVFQEIKSSKFKINEFVTPTPKSIYASTKRVGELLVNNCHAINKKSCNLRISWVYGPPIILKKFNPQRGPIAFILSELFFKNKKKLIFKSGKDFEASFTYIEDICMVITKLLNLKKFKYPTYHFGSGENYSLKKVINFINDNYKDKKIIAGKGYAPWSNDSIIRGPMISSQQINFYKPKTKLLDGIRRYIKFISENKNA